MAPGCASANGDAGVDEENVGTSEDAIRRGLPTSLNNVVRLYLSNGGICSGVLLSSRIVLTAAHCNTNTLSTRVGLSSTATVGVVDYLYSAGADWMLMKLASPGLSGGFVSLSTTTPIANATYTVAGYGNDGTTSGALLAGSAIAAGRQITRPINGSTGTFDIYTAASVSVAGPWPPGVPPPAPRSTVACPGDSGGPVMRYEPVTSNSWGWRVYGILSGGNATLGTNAQRCVAMTETYYAPMAPRAAQIMSAKALLESRPN